MKLEDCLHDAFGRYGLNEPFRGKVISLLDTIKHVDVPTYEHSARTGILSARIGEFSELDPKPLLYGGLLHDVGKSMLDPALLSKGEQFTENDMAKVRMHALNSYFLLKDTFPFTAELALRHHSYQADPYPDIKESDVKFSPKSHLVITIYSRIIALADFYDALRTRQNMKFAGSTKKTLDESDMIRIAVKHNPDREGLIHSLYAEGIFNKFYRDIL